MSEIIRITNDGNQTTAVYVYDGCRSEASVKTGNYTAFPNAAQAAMGFATGLSARKVENKPEDKPELPKHEYHEGEIVRVVGREKDHGFDIGEHIRLCFPIEGAGWKAEYLDGHDWWLVDELDIEPITEDKPAEPKPNGNTFKAGCKARCIKAKNDDFTVGKIYEADFDGFVKDDRGFRFSPYSGKTAFDWLEANTDYRFEPCEEPKPEEFKPGDRVEASCAPFFSEKKPGRILGKNHCGGHLGVEFDDEVPYGHNCGGFDCPTGKSKHCLWCNIDEVLHITETSEQETEAEPVKLYCTHDGRGRNTIKRGDICELGNGYFEFPDGTKGYGTYESLPDFCDRNKGYAEAGFVPLVKRPAKVGEWVYIIKDGTWVSAKYHEGEIYLVDASGPVNDDRCYVSYRTPQELYLDVSEYLVLDGYHPEPDKPAYYTGPVVCVESHGAFAEGFVYRFEAGRVTDNDGNKRPCGLGDAVKSLGGWNETYGDIAKFIPFKGER